MAHSSLPEGKKGRIYPPWYTHLPTPGIPSPPYVRLPPSSRVHRVDQQQQADGTVHGPAVSSHRGFVPQRVDPEKGTKRCLLAIFSQEVEDYRGYTLGVERLVHY